MILTTATGIWERSILFYILYVRELFMYFFNCAVEYIYLSGYHVSDQNMFRSGSRQGVERRDDAWHAMIRLVLW